MPETKDAASLLLEVQQNKFNSSPVVRAQIRLTKEKKPWNVNDISGDREPPMTIFSDTMESLIVNLTFDPHTQKLLSDKILTSLRARH